MAAPTPRAAIDAGLLVFAPEGTCFPARGNRSLPFLINSRGAGTNLPLRRMIVDGLSACLPTLPEFDVIGGISKAGTVWAAWLAWAGHRPYATVHLDAPRSSGLQRVVEGEVAGRRMLLVDNWIRSGSSLAKAVEVVKQVGAIPIGALAIATDGVAEVGIPLKAIWHIDELLSAADCADNGTQKP